jgi:predicted nucleotide-binding protein
MDKIIFDERLTGFLRASRGRSQEDIIHEFLQAAIDISPAADEGSVLIHHPRLEKLVLFHSRFFPDRANAGSRFPDGFKCTQGIAGRCFRERSIQLFTRQSGRATDVDFLGDSPIENMICLPIITAAREPFGVVCFHNNVADKPFTREDVRVLEAYTGILSLALHTPHPELQLERNVFIVHGRDNESLKGLQSILRANEVVPKVLAKEDKNALSILYALEDLIRTCKAGFILATPDDEGRLKGESQIAARARENVIFETGLLFAKFRAFERVAILLKRPLALPSDLNGVTYEPFDDIKSIEPIITRKLDVWGLLR